MYTYIYGKDNSTIGKWMSGMKFVSLPHQKLYCLLNLPWWYIWGVESNPVLATFRSDIISGNNYNINLADEFIDVLFPLVGWLVEGCNKPRITIGKLW